MVSMRRRSSARRPRRRGRRGFTCHVDECQRVRDRGDGGLSEKIERAPGGPARSSGWMARRGGEAPPRVGAARNKRAENLGGNVTTPSGCCCKSKSGQSRPAVSRAGQVAKRVGKSCSACMADRVLVPEGEGGLEVAGRKGPKRGQTTGKYARRQWGGSPTKRG